MHDGDLTKMYAGNLKRTLENFCYSSTHGNEYSVKKVDGVVISHPHFDHYAGLKYLAKHLPECVIPTKLVVTTGFDPDKHLKNVRCDPRSNTLLESNRLQFNMEVNDCFFGLRGLFRFYFHKKVPPKLYHLTPQLAGPEEESKNIRCTESNVHGLSTALCPAESSGSAEPHKGSNNSSTNVSPNEASIILRLQPLPPPDCPGIVLTGDALADRVLEAAGERLSVFQVPHHGSGYHLPRRLSDKLQWVDYLTLLFALSNRHPSLVPHIEALDKRHALKKSAESFKKYISQIGETLSATLKETLTTPLATLENRFPESNIQVEWYKHHHNIFPDSVIKAIDKEEKKQRGRLRLFKDSLGWAHFYYKIRSDLYVVSAGKPFHHPHAEVLNGIIIACKWRGDTCNLVVTNDANLKKPHLFLREVRKVASDSTRVWYLNTFDSSSHQCSNRPFFTIDPWCLQDLHDKSHHPNPIIAVNPFDHDILCSDLYSLLLEDIRDELDVQNNTCTDRANRLTVAISKGYRKGSSQGIDPPLQDYLTSIGYENPYSTQKVSSVLTPLLGPPIVEQLSSLPSRQDSGQSELLRIIPDLLGSNTKGDSEFELTETRSAATSARVNVSIPKSESIQVNRQTVQAASFIVSHARSSRMKVKLKLEFSGKKLQSVDISKHLVLDGSSGQTLADYVASLHCETSTWLSARKMCVGEILMVLLGEEKAIQVVQSLPLFLSFQMNEWSVNNYLTTSVIRDNGTVEEAHIYVKTPIKLPSLFSGKLRLCVESLVVHIFPGYESHDQGRIQIEGDCTINEQHRVRLNSQCGSDFPKNLRLVFSGSFTASDMFHILGINTAPNSLEFPFDGGEIQENVTYTVGLNLSQNLPNTTAVELESLFFQVDSEFKHLLPPPLNGIESAAVHTTIHHPLTHSPKVGLAASFVFKLEIPRRPQSDKTVVGFDCYFSALPSAAKSGYSFGVRVQPYYMPYTSDQSIQGVAVCDVISALCTRIGNKVNEELDNMPIIRTQILESIVMRKLALQISSTAEIQAIELDAAVSQLDIIPRQVQIQSGVLRLQYSSDDGLQLECSGVLSFLEHSTCNVQVVLPTSSTLGKIHFENDHDNLTLNKTLEAFGWLSHDTLSHPVLRNLLDITLRKICIHFSHNLEVAQAELSLYKKELNLGILSLSHVEVSVMLRREGEQYKTSFSIAAFIADTLYAQLQYSSESRLLTGRVYVTCFSHIAGPDAMEAFQLESSDPKNKTFSDLCAVISKQFMTVFRSSQNQQEAHPGLTGFIDVSISVPLKCTGKYALEHLLLEVKDVLKIRSYIIDTFHFEYSRTSFSEDTSSTIQLLAVIRKLECSESMVIKFDLAAKRSQPSTFTATVEPGPQGGLLKLSSVLDLAGCESPGLPKVDLPPVFDFELKYGAITFALSPFQVYGFDVAILIQHWQVFKDPELTVHNVTFRTTWQSGSLPELIFTDCFLTFLGLELSLNGRITPKAVFIDCTKVPRDAEGLPKAVKFESVLKGYSPSTQHSLPVIPKDVGLPPMNVELKQLAIHLEESRKSLRLNSYVTFSDSWPINFGSRPLSVNKLGAALEWEKSKDATKYRAFIYGFFRLCNLSFEVQMALGNNIDSIITAEVSRPDNLPHFGEVADYLLCPTEPIPSQESSIDDLVPPSLKKITSFSITMAINVTKKQFFLSGRVDRWGSGYLLVGHLHDTDEMDYIVSLTLEDGFRFSQLCGSLSFIDEFVTLRCVNVLVSSVELKGLASIIEPYNQALQQLGRNFQTPFSTLPSSELLSMPVKKGTTLYAAIDVSSCRSNKGAISNIFELGDEHLTKCDLIVMVHICSDSQAETYTKVEFHAWISRIKLFQLLVFSDIHLLYKLEKPSGFLLELSGMISLELNAITSVSNIAFDGHLHITNERALFKTSSGSQGVVKQPAGINVEVRDLKLELIMDLKSGKKGTPDLFVSGELTLGSVHLVARFLLKGISFKVFHIKLLQGLMLSLIFDKCGVDWTASSLDIGIREGEFYYARVDTEFIESDGMKHCYEEGYHLESAITLLNTDFRIKADIPHDRKMLSLSGRSVQKIDFGFAKLTGTGKYCDEGPELSYCNKTLCFQCGVEILQQPWFEGSLKYCSHPDQFFEGSIAYQGRILWIDNPRMKIRWSKRDGFQIVEFPILGDLPFNLLGAIAKFAKVLYNLICGIFKWSIKLELKTTRNDDPDKYLVKFILTGTLSVTVVGIISIDVIPLPNIPLNLLRFDDFSLSKLPLYILKCLWNSAGEICKSLLSYLNPVNLAKMLGKVIINAITGVIKAVADVGKKIVSGAKKVWGWFKGIFGFSAFIIDTENNTIVGYICGGKGGKDLCDEEYIVTHFGPFLALHAVGEIATDVHRNAKACVTAKKKIGDTDSLLGEDEHAVQSQLAELQQETQKLSTNLALRAGEILTAGSVCVDVVDGGLSVKWKVSNAEGDVVYSGDKGDIEHHIKVVVTTVTVNQDGKACVESTKVFSKTLTRPDCTMQPKEIQEEGAQSEAVLSKLQDASDCSKPEQWEKVRQKTHPKKLKSIQPSQSNQKHPDETQRTQLVASNVTQSRKQKEKHPGKSKQLHQGKNAYPAKLARPTQQPEKGIQVPVVAHKDVSQSKKHKLTQSVKRKSKDVETDECKETESMGKHVDVKPEQENQQEINSDRQSVLVEEQKVEQENALAESEEEILGLRDKGGIKPIASDVGTTAEIQQDHQHSTQGCDLDVAHVDKQLCTPPVDALPDPDHESEEQKWLEILVPMDAGILSKAVCISVSILPTVTLKVMTLPPQTPKHVDQEMLDRKDKVWMEQIKQEIKDEGREKEVTLFGAKISKDLLTRPNLSATVQFNSITFLSEDGSLMVFGSLTTVPEVTNCLINIIDKNDQIVVVKQLLIPSDSHTSTLDFRLDLHPSDLPKDSQGPYIVVAIALSAEFSTSQSFTVSDIEIPRYPQPGALAQSLPNLDDSTEFYSIDSGLDEIDSSEDASDIVRISWNPPQSESEVETTYSFVVNLVGTCTSDVKRPTKEYLSSELTEQDRLGIDEPAFTLSAPVSSSELDVPCEYTFSLKKLFSSNGIPLNAGLTLQCEVVTVGSHPEVTQHKLPSMPQLTPEFIIVAPPSKVSLSVSDTRPGVLVSWLNSIHALSYRIDIVDEATNTVLLSKAYHCKDKDEKPKYDRFDTDTLLGRNDLKSVPCSDTNSYMLQMYSLGFGEDLLRSLIPTVAGDRLHMFPLGIKYLPHSDSITLSFSSTLETPFSIKLYLEKEMDEVELLEQTEITVLKTKCQFPLYKWRSQLKLKPGCTLSAIAHSTNEEPGVISLGVSSTELDVLPPPVSFSAMEKYESNWTVSEVTMNWTATGQLDSPHYRCGFISMATSSVIFCITTQKTSAKIDITSLPLLKHCTQFNCFVESVGNAKVITSNATLVTTLYQCVTPPAQEDTRIVFTSFSLLRVWCWYLGTTLSQSYLQMPGKHQYQLIPPQQPFPCISIPKKIMRVFWDTESQRQLLFDNGKNSCNTCAFCSDVYT